MKSLRNPLCGLIAFAPRKMLVLGGRDFGVLEFQVPTKMPKVAGIGALVDDFISVGG